MHVEADPEPDTQLETAGCLARVLDGVREPDDAFVLHTGGSAGGVVDGGGAALIAVRGAVGVAVGELGGAV
ncbi:hypothetical protein GCM10022214_12450 [Actinomadura miaoliensis]|uniref:Uncharacterized protein n=1 Tax=Actinomadura miaoliensis TaxID=430685 RepID=A0ABP7V799_9ACTN